MDFNDLKNNLNTLNREARIDELKKLKAEFEEDKYILLNQTVAIQIMDKHISELKGENNEYELF